MSDILDEPQVDQTAYPRVGVRFAINHHAETLGKHRVRLVFDGAVMKLLRRGLAFPRIHVDGDVGHGLRIWAADEGGLAAMQSKGETWHITFPVRRIRAREDAVGVMEVDFLWERDDTGPVIVVPRLPDRFLPEPVLDKLPNSQVDQSTIHERAEKRLGKEVAMLNSQAMMEKLNQWDIEPEPAEVLVPPPAPPLNADAVDLKEALSMVNEIVEKMGDSVVLSIENGRVVAKRRVVSFIDL